MNACEKGHTLILFKDGANCPVCDGAKKYEELTEKYCNLVDQNIDLKDRNSGLRDTLKYWINQYNGSNDALNESIKIDGELRDVIGKMYSCKNDPEKMKTLWKIYKLSRQGGKT